MTVELVLETHIAAPPATVCAASLSIDAHLASMSAAGERAVAGVTSGQIGLGETVTWRARHLGVVWTMTSEITELRAPVWFVDEQVRGPFRSYRHEHRFDETSTGTTMVDHIRFTAPLGPLGRIVELAVLGRYLARLIADRNRHLKRTLEDSRR